MASSAENPTAPQVKVPILPLLIVCIVAVVLAAAGCGGVMLYLAKKGKLGLGGGTTTVVVEEKKEVPTTHPVVLDPMLVNLADEDGHGYLRVSIVLQQEDEKPKDGEKKKEGAEAKPVAGANAALRDTILDILGKQKSPDLLNPDGKEHLKDDLKEALQKEVPEAKIDAVYFTDFLVQR